MPISFLAVLVALTCAACADANPEDPTSEDTSSTRDARDPEVRADPSTKYEGEHADTPWKPDALSQGYMRLEAATMRGIAPSADVTLCQYVMPPVDRDMDVLSVRGKQSVYGHHAVAFSYTGTGKEEMHKPTPCGGTEFSTGDPEENNGHAEGQGGFLGSTGVEVPEGVAFRLKKGDGIMLNIHYVNFGDEPIDGEAYLDVKLVDADPNQKLASLFTALHTGFSLDAHTEGSGSSDCVVKSDLEFLMMSNHMHEYGSTATTEVVRAGSGEVELLHEDEEWTPEMQFNPIFSRWTASRPFVVRAGDTLRTSCSWLNTTDGKVTFPREMCISAGFVLTSGALPVAPGTCANGNWIPAS